MFYSEKSICKATVFFLSAFDKQYLCVCVCVQSLTEQARQGKRTPYEQLLSHLSTFINQRFS